MFCQCNLTVPSQPQNVRIDTRNRSATIFWSPPEHLNGDSGRYIWQLLEWMMSCQPLVQSMIQGPSLLIFKNHLDKYWQTLSYQLIFLFVQTISDKALYWEIDLLRLEASVGPFDTQGLLQEHKGHSLELLKI